MTNTIDPVPYWTREIEQLRAQVVKNRRRSDPSALGDVAERALMVCETLLQELAGARLECERLRAEARTETATWERLFDVMPGACLLTDGASAILTANRAAGYAPQCIGQASERSATAVVRVGPREIPRALTGASAWRPRRTSSGAHDTAEGTQGGADGHSRRSALESPTRPLDVVSHSSGDGAGRAFGLRSGSDGSRGRAVRSVTL